jgi:WD40 repeat protein
MQILSGGKERLMRLAFSPDGRFLAAGSHGGFQMWELAAGPEPLWSITTLASAHFVFTADGASLIGGGGTFVRLTDVRTGVLHEIPSLREFEAAAFTPDGRFAVRNGYWRSDYSWPLRMARFTPNGWVEVWRKELPPAPEAVQGLYRPVVFSVDGARLFQESALGHGVLGTWPVGIEVFDTATGDRVGGWTGELPVGGRLGSASASGLLVMYESNAICVIDTTAPGSKPVVRSSPGIEHLTSAEFSRDGSQLATTGDTTATVWDTTTWEVQRRYEWQIGGLRSVCFAPDGLRCAAGSGTGQIVVWDIDE